MTNNNVLGRRINKLMIENDTTQEYLANRFSVTQGTISKWISGNRKPDIITLIEIAKCFDVTTDYLLGLSDIEKNQRNDLLDGFVDILIQNKLIDSKLESVNIDKERLEKLFRLTLEAYLLK